MLFAIKRHRNIFAEVFGQRWLRAPGAALTALGLYDLLLSQGLPEELAKKWPRLHEVIAMTGGWLPWWAWGWIVTGFAAIVIFEYAVRLHSRLAENWPPDQITNEGDATPDISVRKLFLKLYPNIMSAIEYEQNGFASKVRDKLALGQLIAWGRDDDAPRNPGEHGPPKEIAKIYWQIASLIPGFFLGSDDYRDLVHAAPQVGTPGPHYRDVCFNRAQAEKVWPELVKR